MAPRRQRVLLHASLCAAARGGAAAAAYEQNPNGPISSPPGRLWRYEGLGGNEVAAPAVTPDGVSVALSYDTQTAYTLKAVGISPTGGVLWTYGAGAGTNATPVRPVIGGERAYVVGAIGGSEQSNALFALDLLNDHGNPIEWSWQDPDGSSDKGDRLSRPSVADGNVYIVSHRVESNDSGNPDPAPSVNATCVSSLYSICTGGGDVNCSIAPVEVRWRYAWMPSNLSNGCGEDWVNGPAPPPALWTLRGANVSAVAACAPFGRRVHLVNRSSGLPLWPQVPLDGECVWLLASDPDDPGLYPGGNGDFNHSAVLVAGGEWGVQVIDAATGASLWADTALRPIAAPLAPAAVCRGAVHVTNREHAGTTSVVALNQTDGMMLWRWIPNAPIGTRAKLLSPPTCRDGLVYVTMADRVTGDLSVCALTAGPASGLRSDTGGALLWRAAVPGRHCVASSSPPPAPGVGGGLVLVASPCADDAETRLPALSAMGALGKAGDPWWRWPLGRWSLIAGAAAVVAALSAFWFAVWRRRRTGRGSDSGSRLNGRYVTERRLGSGGFGQVFLVRRRRDGARLAMKRIVVGTAEERDSALAEFRVLAEARQGHPHMVQLVDTFMCWQEDAVAGNGASDDEEDPLRSDPLLARSGWVAIVMPYYQRGDLRQYITGHTGAVPEATIALFAGQIASLLAHLHSRSPPIVHRDLKPENVLLSDDASEVVVTDFGLARRVEESYLRTQAGTLAYLAPECWGRHYGTPADVWSLGCVMYGMVTRRVCRHNVRILFTDAHAPGFQLALCEEVSQLGYSDAMARRIASLLAPDPDRRPTAAAACGAPPPPPPPAPGPPVAPFRPFGATVSAGSASQVGLGWRPGANPGGAAGAPLLASGALTDTSSYLVLAEPPPLVLPEPPPVISAPRSAGESGVEPPPPECDPPPPPAPPPPPPPPPPPGSACSPASNIPPDVPWE